jgi:hypothetical protein
MSSCAASTETASVGHSKQRTDDVRVTWLRQGVRPWMVSFANGLLKGHAVSRWGRM